MNTVALKFPLPDKGLYWNRRTHYMQSARLKKAARRLGWQVADQTLRNADLPPEGVLWKGYSIEPHYEDKRVRDDDNLTHACKSHLDGIFNDYLHVDDSKVRCLGVNPVHEKKITPYMIIYLHYESL